MLWEKIKGQDNADLFDCAELFGCVELFGCFKSSGCFEMFWCVDKFNNLNRRVWSRVNWGLKENWFGRGGENWTASSGAQARGDRTRGDSRLRIAVPSLRASPSHEVPRR